MEIIGLVTARGGSKSIPRKNIKTLAGKPLIAWTIEDALKSQYLSKVITSTDNAEIAAIAREGGADVPFMRPPELAQDESPHFAAVEHAIHWLEKYEGRIPDYILTLQPTSPLRTADDIDSAIEIARKHDADAVVSVCESVHHPYLAKRILENGSLSDFISTDIYYLRRQVFPPAYALNGAIYLNRSESILREQVFCPTNTYAYIMPSERSLDIDSDWDFYLAELILANKYEKTNN